MRIAALMISVSAFCTFSVNLSAFAENNSSVEKTIWLNNQGVKALFEKKWSLAFEKFESALKIDPNYALAKDNMTITHGRYGEDLLEDKRYAEALDELHKAAFRDIRAHTPFDWNASINKCIIGLGKDPDSLKDRTELGENAEKREDYVGAVVEFRASLRLNNNSIEAHEKIGKLLLMLNETVAAKSEFDKVEKLKSGQ